MPNPIPPAPEGSAKISAKSVVEGALDASLTDKSENLRLSKTSVAVVKADTFEYLPGGAMSGTNVEGISFHTNQQDAAKDAKHRSLRVRAWMLAIAGIAGTSVLIWGGVSYFSGNSATGKSPGTPPQPPSSRLPTLSPEQAAQLEIMDRKARQFLKKSEGAILTPADRNDVIDLDLGITRFDKVGVGLLTNPVWGYVNVHHLSLADTPITDGDLATLCRDGASLGTVRWLDLSGTHIGRLGIAALTGAGSPFTDTTSLDLSGTNIGDSGFFELASSQSALKKIATLHLLGATISRAALDSFSQPGSSLGTLTVLNLRETVPGVNDDALKYMARPESAIVNLADLDTRGTGVGPEGIRAVQARWKTTVHPD